MNRSCKLHLLFLRKRSPDGATPNWGSRHPIAAYYSFIDPKGMKGWVGLAGWPIADGLPTWVVTRQLQVERRTAKFAGQRPTIYRWATQPTKSCVNGGMYREGRRRRRRVRWRSAVEWARHISTSATGDRPRTSCRRCTDCPGTSYHSSAGSWTAYRDVPPTYPANEAPC